MTTQPTTAPIPIVCDMTGAPDTAEERMAEWGRLFAAAYVGRERVAEGIQFRFRADDGIEAWVRDLAMRDKACCPFLDFTVTTPGDQVWWDCTVAAGVDDQIARSMLDDLYTMPDTVTDGVAGMEERYAAQGFTMTTKATGTILELQQAQKDT
jgi:hypothetical protein